MVAPVAYMERGMRATKSFSRGVSARLSRTLSQTSQPSMATVVAAHSHMAGINSSHPRNTQSITREAGG